VRRCKLVRGEEEGNCERAVGTSDDFSALVEVEDSWGSHE
jgi:hypothetical protein